MASYFLSTKVNKLLLKELYLDRK